MPYEVRVIGLYDNKKSVQGAASQKLALEAFALVSQTLDQIRQFLAFHRDLVRQTGQRIVARGQGRGLGCDALVSRGIREGEWLLLASVDQDFHVKIRFLATSLNANTRCLKIPRLA